MATNDSVNSPLFGTSGTGQFAGTNSPTFITPTLGVAGATSLQFTPSTNGIIGTITNDSASAGRVGELIQSTILEASGVSTLSTIVTNVTSVNLSAGDWDLWANVFFLLSAGVTGFLGKGWINNVSAAAPDKAFTSETNLTSVTVGENGIVVPGRTFQLAAPATIYLSVVTTFAGATLKTCGGLYARRRR